MQNTLRLTLVLSLSAPALLAGDQRDDFVLANGVEATVVHIASAPKQSTFTLLEYWQATITRLGGSNPIARGTEKGSSGAQDALASANALKSQNALASTYVDLLREVATATVEIYQQFATEERTIEIVGSDVSTTSS